VREKTVDGFLVLYDGRGTTLSEQIAQYRIPSVWINQKQAENAVYPDDYGNTRRLVLELAAKRAGHLLYFGPASYPDSHYSVADRRRGFDDGLKDTGRSGEVCEAPEIEEGADFRHALIRSILQRKRKRSKIVITYSVEDAEAFYIQAALLGLKIPGDLLVCSFVRQGGVGSRITR
jgi:DNA-binding LacI/PurR family transcriptional regulator